ncbi:g4865 [Coccomyxa viridis]|uniref:G4865 protein n=1 Tax=Coccomyxa viridis TaxID=1274662 RepID=A0ABP1FST5_9CHLO
MAETTVVVTGATGMQGGGVVDHLLADKRKKYHVRGITRSVSSPKAQKLASRGVEVVEGDLEHKDTLVKAFRGADAAFILTDFTTAKTAEKEFQQGKNAIHAAKEAGVKFVVFSTLETMPKDVKATLPEIEPGYTVPHFESKARVQAYLENSGILQASLLTSAFFDNFLGGFKLQKQEMHSALLTTLARVPMRGML